ncbi:sensor histidine kinase [Saccharothrix deserti]|uniref:sensor histidine kinase n=1 Tax=Saccharothrix deserti TaxID=2593674 RepID=UPI00131DB093|nr:histidine kinase [Saccharothrix deserti]
MESTKTSGIRGWMCHHPLVVDAALGCLLVVAGVVGELKGVGERHDGVITGRDIAALVVVLLAVTLRRKWPQHTLVATAAAVTVLVATTGVRQVILLVAVVIAAFTTASRTSRRVAWTTAGAVAVVMYLVDAFGSTGSVWSPQSIGIVAWIGMATAVGDAARSRRAWVAEVVERAHRAEQTREEEASRRVIQERLRIARELHDVVAHHIAVINVQAGAASHVLHRQPEQANRALTHIRTACDTVLSELSSIVGVLRQSDDDPDSSTEPVRGLSRLADMVDALAAAGLTVERRQIGVTRELPAVVDLAAYRIMQEALTNAHKYGTGTAGLTITYTPEGITIDVVNTVAAERTPAQSGYGIVGMRERAAAAGGTLEAQVGPNGRFTVHAELPAPALKAVS